MLRVKIPSRLLFDHGVPIVDDGTQRSGFDWLRFPGVSIEDVIPDVMEHCDSALAAEIAEDARYAPYLDRQDAEIAVLRRDESLPIPPDFDFGNVPGLSNEMVERLILAGPDSIAAAARIRGITPAALSAILLHARRRAA